MQTDAVNNEYFSSYEDLEIHKLMLEDEPRNLAYRNAILNNTSYFKDKVVMDVGCGTGFLSILCAQAGARKVYAVEASTVANLACEIIKENGFEDVIEVINDRVENVVLPNDTKVDAIVSEWMGFYLLHEGMLDSVLIARDKFLKKDGEMFPESAVIYIAPCSMSLLKKWENINGVAMKSFAKQLLRNKHYKPEIVNIQPDDLLGEEVALSWINLREDKITDLDSYSVQHVVGAKKTGIYQGLCVWFECNFPDLSEGKGGNRLVLDTSPHSLLTHWKQTIIVLPKEQEVEKGEPIAFQLDMNRDPINNRRYNLQMTLLDPEAVDHPQPCSCDMTKCIIINTFMQQHAEHAIENKLDTNNTIKDDPIEDDLV